MTTDWVVRMQALLTRHEGAVWETPGDDPWGEHVVTLGDRVLGRSGSLAALVIELEELERAGRVGTRPVG